MVTGSCCASECPPHLAVPRVPLVIKGSAVPGPLPRAPAVQSSSCSSLCSCKPSYLHWMDSSAATFARNSSLVSAVLTKSCPTFVLCRWPIIGDPVHVCLMQWVSLPPHNSLPRIRAVELRRDLRRTLDHNLLIPSNQNIQSSNSVWCSALSVATVN